DTKSSNRLWRRSDFRGPASKPVEGSTRDSGVWGSFSWWRSAVPRRRTGLRRTVENGCPRPGTPYRSQNPRRFWQRFPNEGPAFLSAALAREQRQRHHRLRAGTHAVRGAQSATERCHRLRGFRPAGGLLSSGWDNERPDHADNLIRRWRWFSGSNPNRRPLVLHAERGSHHPRVQTPEDGSHHSCKADMPISSTPAGGGAE